MTNGETKMTNGETKMTNAGHKSGYYVVKTAFHGGGVVSWHRTQPGAERAARAWASPSCTCGCAGVVSAKEYDNLESQDHNQCWTKNPYALTR